MQKDLLSEEREEAELRKTITGLGEASSELANRAGEARREAAEADAELQIVRGRVSKLEGAAERKRRERKTELKFYRDYMGLSMVPIKENQIKLLFTMIDKRDLEREYSVSIDIGHQIGVLECSPPVGGMEKIAESVQGEEDIIPFIKRARELFIHAAQEERAE
ncbi:MAG: kinetochore protein Spc25 [Amphiamblys sp. WSBS2006]|nr:MAG: kinetochore protein Spc25 [Amphiamblys sp. WSBS2006]